MQKVVEVAVWAPKRTNRWRGGKDKEPKASSKPSFGLLAM